MLLLLNAPADLRVPLPGRGRHPAQSGAHRLRGRRGLPHRGRPHARSGRPSTSWTRRRSRARRVFERIAESAGRPLPRGSLPTNLATTLLRTPGLDRISTCREASWSSWRPRWCGRSERPRAARQQRARVPGVRELRRYDGALRARAPGAAAGEPPQGAGRSGHPFGRFVLPSSRLKMHSRALACGGGPGGGHRSPARVLLEETQGPPRFLGDPCPRATLSDPGAVSCTLALAQQMLPSASITASARNHRCSFGAPSRGPRTRCLRFTLPIARQRARLASGWLPALPGGGSTRGVPSGVSM